MVKYRITVILLLFMFLLSSGNVLAYQNRITLPSEGASGIGDPFILKHNGIYYLYATTKSEGNDKWVKCWSSRDLTKWEYRGAVVHEHFDETPFAPEVVYWNGYFYMYTAPGGGGHIVLKSDSPVGPFKTQTGNVGLAIDGSVFIDDDGKWYFYRASRSGIRGHEMKDPYTFGPEKQLNAHMLNQWTEGPSIIKRNGKYYLTYTGNHFLSEGYRIDYAVSNSGPLGKYVMSPENPIMVSTEGKITSIGHSSPVMGPDLDTYFIVYHNREAKNRGIRHLNMDRLAWNGDKMLALGPTDFAQPDPQMPDFYDYFDRDSIGDVWNSSGGSWKIQDKQFLIQEAAGEVINKIVTKRTSTENYTAEFNMKEINRGTSGKSGFGAVFSYKDEKNYGTAVLDSSKNHLKTQFIINGTAMDVKTSNLPADFDYSKLHNIRIEKSGTTFRIYVDNMLKQSQNISGLGGGSIGYVTEGSAAMFGFAAFSKNVDGNGIIDLPKPVPGTLDAVHFTSGGTGSTGSESKVLRGSVKPEGVELKEYPDGGNAVVSKAGSWFNYPVNVSGNASYNFVLRYSSVKSNTKIKLFVDGEDKTGEISLPVTGGADKWRSFTIKGLDLTAGNHELKVETIQGQFDFYNINIYSADNSAIEIKENFDSGFQAKWNYNDGNWSLKDGQITVDDSGKRAVGNTGWSNYTVEADIKGLKSLNSGILFRLRNPAAGYKDDKLDIQQGIEFLQGYYAGIRPDGIRLEKVNYGTKLLAEAPGTFDINTSYHMKVVVNGSRIQIYVDDMKKPKIDFTDTDPFTHGKAGLRALRAATSFDNFQVTMNSDKDPFSWSLGSGEQPDGEGITVGGLMFNKKTLLFLGILIVPLGILAFYGKTLKNDVNLSVKEVPKELVYSNPTSIKNIGDPFALKASDGKYYCYPTSGWKVWSSADLFNWKLEGNVYKKTSKSWGVAKFWAPEVVEHKGKYYNYYTAERAGGGLRIGVAVSDSPTGPFEDAFDHPLVDFGYSAIDANVLIDDDGRKYLYYSRDVSENVVDQLTGRKESQIYVVELNDDMVSLKGEPKFLIRPEQKWELASGPKMLWNEGPEVFKRNGIYYLMYSGNLYSTRNYSVGYATSDSPTGPFKKYENNPVLSAEGWGSKVSGPGHHSVTKSPDGSEWWVVYHTHTNPAEGGGNRQVNIDRMGFREDGSIYINGPTLTEQPMPSGSSEYRNIASEATVTASSAKEGYRTSAITDGEIGIYARNEKYEWAANKEGSGAWVQLEWESKRKISSIFIYDSASKDRKIKTGKLVFSNGKTLDGITFPDEPGAAAIVNFDEMEVKWVKFVVSELQDRMIEAGLSEIMVFEKNIK